MMNIFEDDDVLKCPYCERIQEGHEPDEISAYMCHVTCEHCDKDFWYSVSVIRTYYPYKDEEDGDDGDEEKDELY